MRSLQFARSTSSLLFRSVRAFSTAEELIYSEGACKDELFGPLAVKLLGEKGRGFIATKDIELGDLLACVRPVAFLRGDVDDAPDAALLMPQLAQVRLETLPWSVRVALQHLSDGSQRGSPPKVPPTFWDPSAAAAGTSDTGAGAPWPPPTMQLARVLKVNAFGDDYEDLAAAAARGAGGHSVVGLWPAFSYFNHSCLPTTVHYVVGDRMVVRAVTDMPAGDEVTVSYLGREEFAPAEARQAVLQERWGFRCECERCTVEAAAPPELNQVVKTAYARVMQDLRPAFLEAARDGEPSRLAAAADGLRGVDATVRAAIKEHAQRPGVHPATATFVQAALYELLELLYAATQLEEDVGATGGDGGPERGQAALAALSRCLSILDSVSRGAELHVFVACALLQRAAALRGADSPVAAAALQLLGQASEARYGKDLGAGLLDQLQSANTELAGEFL